LGRNALILIVLQRIEVENASNRSRIQRINCILGEPNVHDQKMPKMRHNSSWGRY